MASNLMEYLKEIQRQHKKKMKTSARYRETFARMQEATKPREPSRHYDRDGYCDNPGRGY